MKALRAQVVDGITYADTYLDLLPASEHKTAALAARQEAARKLDMAGQLAPAARSAEDFARMEAVLQQAADEVQTSRKAIDLATGGTGIAVGVAGTNYTATPAAANGAAFQAAPVVSDLRADLIPENERSACFFCSRPARISELKPVTFVVNGQRRKVLACADDVQSVERGTTPEVQSVSENGQNVPWFRARSYNPYRDYGHATFSHAQPAGSSGGFGHASVGVTHSASPAHGITHTESHPSYCPAPTYYDNGLSDAIFWSLMLTPEPVPYPVFVEPNGMVTGDPGMAFAPPMGYDGPLTDGTNGMDSGYDFGMPAPDSSGWDAFDAQDNGAFPGGSDGSDFGDLNLGGDSGAGWDNGGSDAGSGFDSSGSSDWGGSDSGSSFDSGGGSDFGGGGDS